MELSAEERLIILGCSIRLNNERSDQLQSLLSKNLDWEYISRIGFKHDVINLLYNNLAQAEYRSNVPQYLLDQFKKIHLITAYKNSFYFQEYQTILKSFNKNNIYIIPLKGISLVNEVYKNIALRNLSDIDLLVKKQELDDAEVILKNQGYSQKQMSHKFREKHFHSIFYKKRGEFMCIVEMHWDIDFSDTPFNVRIEDFWQRAVKMTKSDISFFQFCIEDIIIYNCLHIIQHALEQHFISLKNLCDITEIIQLNQGSIKWENIYSISEKNNLVRPVLLVSVLLKQLFDAPIPDFILKAFERHDIPVLFLQSLIKERIFTRSKTSLPPPQKFMDFAKNKNYLKKTQTVYFIFKRFLYEFDSIYYADISPSFFKTVPLLLKSVGKSFLNYLKTLFLLITDYNKTLEMIHEEAERIKEQETLDRWISNK